MRHEKENRRDCLFAPIRLVGIPLGHPPDAHSDLSKPAGLFSRPSADKPSKALRNILKVGMAADIMEQDAALETNEGIDGDETEIHED